MHEVLSSPAADYFSDCSEYHRNFFTTGEFFEPNQAHIKELFSILNLPWSDDENEFLEFVRKKLIGKDGDKQPFTDEQAKLIQPLLVKMGLFEAFMPPDDHYPVLIIPGGTADAFDGRLPWVLQLDVDQVVIPAGDRSVDSSSEIAQAFPKDGQLDEWVKEIIKDAFDEQGQYIPGALHETDIAGQMLRRLGRVSLKEVHMMKNTSKDQYLSLHYQRNGEDIERDVIIMHGEAVDRAGLGAKRPTTKSTILEYLDRHAPPRNGAIIPIVVASAGLFTMRMIEEVQRIVWDHGRDDIIIVPAAAAPEDNTFYNWARMGLPEIGRLICRSPSLSSLQAA